MSGGSKNQTTTQQVIIPDEVKPLLSGYLQRANVMSYAPSSNQMMQDAVAQMQGQAGQAYSGINTATQGLLGVAQGQYLDSNPYFDQTVDKAMSGITRNYQEATAPQTDASFHRAGVFGGSAWGQAVDRNQRALAEALGSTENQMRSGNYQQERANQMQAFGLLPSVASSGMGVAQNLYGAGQNVLNEDAQRLAILGNAVGVGMGAAGSSSTAPNPNYRSPLQTAAMMLPFFL